MTVMLFSFSTIVKGLATLSVSCKLSSFNENHRIPKLKVIKCIQEAAELNGYFSKCQLTIMTSELDQLV